MINGMKYIVHACNKRKWYVDEFLIPSMREQGIMDVKTYLDKDGRGCLPSMLASFRECGKRRISAWHLQDDVVLSRDFAEKSQNIDRKIVNMGFWHRFDGDQDLHPGRTKVSDMTYSFPCVYVPHNIAQEFAEWYFDEAVKREQYKKWIEAKKYGDSFFRDFMRERHTDEYVYNFKPSLVEHIDWLIGGSTINQYRDGICRAGYWEDETIIEVLKDKLAHRK